MSVVSLFVYGECPVKKFTLIFKYPVVELYIEYLQFRNGMWHEIKSLKTSEKHMVYVLVAT
jgi:hypothetical protein